MLNRSCAFLLALGGALLNCRTASSAEGTQGEVVQTFSIESGELSVLLRDNALSPGLLSGVDSLFNRKDAPGFDAFDPDDRGASAGLNFEHVICGHSNSANAFTPRRGRYELRKLDDRSAMLVRKAEDDPWALASTFKYAVREPHAIDFEFECRAHNKALFGQRGYAVLFFADYMNDVADTSIHFRGVSGPGATEEWISADAPPGHADFNRGGTYRSLPAQALEYDANHNFKLNLWSYDYPRFTQPFYSGRASNDMAFILMFDQMRSAEAEIRFSVFKFKLPRRPRPAWDFQYVIHKVADNRAYGFKGRLVWKKFISAEDCWAEYRRWRAALPSSTPADSQSSGRQPKP